MKWFMLLIVMVVLLVMVFLGLRLIDSGSDTLDNETKLSPEYNSTEVILGSLFVGVSAIPIAVGIIAVIAVLIVLVRLV